MKTTLLYAFLIFSSLISAQIDLTTPYLQDFEDVAIEIGDDVTADITPSFEDEITMNVGGTVTSIIAVGANTTKVAATSANFPNSGLKNHYFSSPAFSCTPGDSFTLSYDLNASNGKINCRLATSADKTTYNQLDTSDVQTTASVGTVKESNHQVNMGNNTSSTVTMVFTAPLGSTSFKLRLYQFGTNSFEFDNLSVTKTPSLSVESIQRKHITIDGNIIKNFVSFFSEIPIEKVEIISISGVRESLTSNGNNNYDMSSYASGMYIIKTTLSNNTTECFKIVKI